MPSDSRSHPRGRAARVTVANDELVTVRDAMRGLNRMVEQLQAGERDQFVLIQRGRMVARVVPIDGGDTTP